MNKFLCFLVYSGKILLSNEALNKFKKIIPEPNKFNKEPVEWCIMGAGKTYSGKTLEKAKEAASIDNFNPEFIENCGWILLGEEDKLLNEVCQEIIALGLSS